MKKVKALLAGLSAVMAVAVLGTVAYGYAVSARWPSTNVVFYVNPHNADVDAASAESAVRVAMEVWNTQGDSGFRYVYGGNVNDTTTGYDGRNVVVFRNASNGAALASTYSWWSGDTMLDADVIFWDASYQFFTGTVGCDGGGAYIEDVGTHELGHALGLKHSTVADATMFPSIAYCSQEMRTLAADDVAGLQSLYGSGNGGGGNGNTAPNVSIAAPVSGASFAEGEAIGFAGSADDAQDGVLTSSISWTSSVDGFIGTGGSFSRTLSVGSHTITAKAVDSVGASGARSVSIIVVAASQPVPPSDPAPAPPPAPVLSASGYAQRNAQKVQLSWSGFTTDSIDVYRNNLRVMTTPNDGAQTDSIRKGSATSYQYYACNTGTSTCSGTITVTF